MMSEPIQIDESFKEAFLEITNIGIGKAADSMSRLAGRHVEITVPDIVFASTDSEEMHHVRDLQTHVLVEQGFSEDAEGIALLNLTQEGAVKLAGMMLGESFEDESFGDIAQGAILELGNIMICGLMGSFSNMLEFELVYDVPELQLNGTNKVEQLTQNHHSFLAMLRCSLAIGEDEVSGSMIISMARDDFLKVTQKIKTKFFEG